MMTQGTGAGPDNRSRLHADYSHDWWTPRDWYWWACRTLRTRAPFDPCRHDWTPDQPSGLDVAWTGPTYCNHPGARGSTVAWWGKYVRERAAAGGRLPLVWCAFNIEQFRHMRPRATLMDGWLVLPDERVAFIWGGPDDPENLPKRQRKLHGQPGSAPGHWAAWWTTEKPAPVPQPCAVIRTQAGQPWPEFNP